MGKWADRWAVVTGASSGIGAEFARQLAARGMHLVLTARREDLLKELAAELEQRHGAKSLIIPLDLNEPDAPKKLFDQVTQADIDCVLLVNNAGFGQITTIEDTNVDETLALLDLNIRALTELTYRFLGPMREKDEGWILNVASIAGFLPIAYMPAYSSSKAYVLHFTEALWTELRHTNVRLSALCPGTTQTPFFEVAGRPNWLQTKKGQPVGKVVKTGLKALERGRPSVVSGWKNWFVTLAPRFFPRRLVAIEASRHFRTK